jgi:hypothetical protein
VNPRHIPADTQAAAADWVCSILRLVSRRAVLTLQQEQRGEWETIVTEAPSWLTPRSRARGVVFARTG